MTMPNVRACLPCKNDQVAEYVRKRVGLGAAITTISAELAQSHRMQQFGYGHAPGPSMLQTHVTRHAKRSLALVSDAMPSFEAPPAAPPPVRVGVVGDVAETIREQALAQLARGEMKISANHALRAQEIVDRRLEKQADRELQVAFMRVLTKMTAPPPELMGEEDVHVIEGTAVTVQP